MFVSRIYLAWSAFAEVSAYEEHGFDLEARRSVMFRCFMSTSMFFHCCGRFRIFRGGLVAPPKGCYPELDDAFEDYLSVRATKILLGFKISFGLYNQQHTRCCKQPLHWYRKTLWKRYEGQIFLNWTMFRVDPTSYMGSDDILELPGFGINALGAASISESIESILAAARDQHKFDEAVAINRNRYALGVGFVLRNADGRHSDDFLSVFDLLQEHSVSMSSVLVDFGSLDGWDAQNPFTSFKLMYGSKVKGLAFEGDPTSCEKFRKRKQSFKLHCERLTLRSLSVGRGLEDISDWAPECMTAEPQCVDAWKIDIDGIDCSVLQLMLQSSRKSLHPKVVFLEVNTHIPPPIKFSIIDIPSAASHAEEAERLRWALYGCSLSYQVHLLAKFDYWLVAFSHKDALFVHRKFAHAFGVSGPIDEFLSYRSAIVMNYDTMPPSKLRQWFSAEPHNALVEVEKHMWEARQSISQQVTITLAI